jgi:hypothetical protein
MLGGDSETFGDKAKIAYLGKQESSNMNSKKSKVAYHTPNGEMETWGS